MVKWWYCKQRHLPIAKARIKTTALNSVWNEVQFHLSLTQLLCFQTCMLIVPFVVRISINDASMLSASVGKLCGWPFGIDKKEEKAGNNVQWARHFYLLLFRTNNTKMPREMLSRTCPTMRWSGIGLVVSDFVQLPFFFVFFTLHVCNNTLNVIFQSN